MLRRVVFPSCQRCDTGTLRDALLSVSGVGPETADDILLYAFDRPVFVIDAYTRRLFSRLGLIAGDEAYEDLRLACEDKLGADAGCTMSFTRSSCSCQDSLPGSSSLW